MARAALALFIAALVSVIILLFRKPIDPELSNGLGGSDSLHVGREGAMRATGEAGAPAISKSAGQAGASKAFFDRKSREEILVKKREVSSTNSIRMNSWFKDEPSYASAKTNEVSMGGRSVTVVSRKPVNEVAIRAYLQEQGELDAKTAVQLTALKSHAATLKAGMRTNEVFPLFQIEPSRSATRDGKLFVAYSPHPTKSAPDMQSRFSVLYLTFGADGKLEQWLFSSR